MIGPTLFALVLLAPVENAKTTLVARYRQYNDAALRNDGKAMVAWYERYATPDFTYRSKDGNAYRRKDFINGLRDQSASIQKVLKSTFQVKKVDTKGNAATASVVTDFEGRIKFDTTILRIVDKSTMSDTWVNQRGKWLLKRSVQVEANTQMFGN